MPDSPFSLPHHSAALHGQVALATGATSGLGWRFAQGPAAGGTVAATGRRPDRLDALAADISRHGGTCLPLPLDVAEAPQLVAVVDRIEHALGTVSILVDNAAIPDAHYATRMPVEQVARVIATNLRAPFLLSSDITRRLIAERLPGRIVNVSSMGAHHYRGEGASLYSTTKAARERMTETLSVEWAPFHINLNAIAPGGLRHREVVETRKTYPQWPLVQSRRVVGGRRVLAGVVRRCLSPLAKLRVGGGFVGYDGVAVANFTEGALRPQGWCGA